MVSFPFFSGWLYNHEHIGHKTLVLLSYQKNHKATGNFALHVMNNFAEVGWRNGDIYDDISWYTCMKLSKMKKKSKQYNGNWSSWKLWAEDNLFNCKVNLYKEVNLMCSAHLNALFIGFPSKVTI